MQGARDVDDGRISHAARKVTMHWMDGRVSREVNADGVCYVTSHAKWDGGRHSKRQTRGNITSHGRMNDCWDCPGENLG